MRVWNKQKKEIKEDKRIRINLTFIDETKYNTLFDEYINEKMCICIAMIDNYEELLPKIITRRKTIVLAKIDKALYDWTSSAGGLVIKNERDTYVILFKQKFLPEIEKKKIAVP